MSRLTGTESRRLNVRQGIGITATPPDRFCLVAGAADARTELTAFDLALLQAGIGDLNLVRVSSILPAQATESADIDVLPGSLLAVAYAAIQDDAPGTPLAAAVAVGIPGDDGPGVIMEHSGRMTAAEAEAEVERMVREAFAYRNRPLADVRTAVAHRTVSDAWSACVAAVALFSSVSD